LQAVFLSKLPAEAQAVVDEYIQAALNACRLADGQEEAPLTADSASGELAANYLLALLDGNRQRATDLLLNAADEGKTIAELYEQVLARALAEVGRMWVAGEISVAEEHFITATARDTMARLRTHAECASPNGKTVLAAAVAGNQHDVGLHMVVDLFELAGWRAVILGANVPVDDLVTAVNDFSADVLLLSAALPVHLPTVRESIEALRAGQSQPVAVIVGGPAFQADPNLWSQLGADGCASSGEAAIRLADQLVSASD
jgi:methanogenic corrinoid protein MtbC1